MQPGVRAMKFNGSDSRCHSWGLILAGRDGAIAPTYEKNRLRRSTQAVLCLLWGSNVVLPRWTVECHRAIYSAN